MNVLYNLHSEGPDYRITKFLDGEVASSYILNAAECECPRGHHYTCRHRQMLPLMLQAGVLNTHWFWHREFEFACDMNGFAIPPILTKPEPTQPHSPTATTAGFDRADTGSIPVVAAKSSPPWRRI